MCRRLWNMNEHAGRRLARSCGLFFVVYHILRTEQLSGQILQYSRRRQFAIFRPSRATSGGLINSMSTCTTKLVLPRNKIISLFRKHAAVSRVPPILLNFPDRPRAGSRLVNPFLRIHTLIRWLIKLQWITDTMYDHTFFKNSANM